MGSDSGPSAVISILNFALHPFSLEGLSQLEHLQCCRRTSLPSANLLILRPFCCQRYALNSNCGRSSSPSTEGGTGTTAVAFGSPSPMLLSALIWPLRGRGIIDDGDVIKECVTYLLRGGQGYQMRSSHCLKGFQQLATLQHVLVVHAEQRPVSRPSGGEPIPQPFRSRVG